MQIYRLMNATAETDFIQAAAVIKNSRKKIIEYAY